MEDEIPKKSRYIRGTPLAAYNGKVALAVLGVGLLINCVIEIVKAPLINRWLKAGLMDTPKRQMANERMLRSNFGYRPPKTREQILDYYEGTKEELCAHAEHAEYNVDSFFDLE